MNIKVNISAKFTVMGKVLLAYSRLSRKLFNSLPFWPVLFITDNFDIMKVKIDNREWTGLKVDIERG